MLSDNTCDHDNQSSQEFLPAINAPGEERPYKAIIAPGVYSQGYKKPHIPSNPYLMKEGKYTDEKGTSHYLMRGGQIVQHNRIVVIHTRDIPDAPKE